MSISKKSLLCAVLYLVSLHFCTFGFAETANESISDGIPIPQKQEVIVQLFNWQFADIEKIIPRLAELGYSHIHVSPPQKSNSIVDQWYRQYQPVDFFTFEGLGSVDDFRSMCQTAQRNRMHILVDVVFNHMTGFSSQPDPPYFTMSDDGVCIIASNFPQLNDPNFFHEKRKYDNAREEEVLGWLFDDLADLKTELPEVREIAKQYLVFLKELGASGFRFDAARHIEPDFYPEVLKAVPGTFSFAEIANEMEYAYVEYLPINELSFYDFPLLVTMKRAFALNGSLKTLIAPSSNQFSIEGKRSITFVRNHDIDRGQVKNGGFEDSPSREKFGVGWTENEDRDSGFLWREDVNLAYAYIFGRESGFPYVFVDMPGDQEDCKDDRYDDIDIVAAIRFHNLCLTDTIADAKPEVWRICEDNVIGWQRGQDRFIVINKSAEPFRINNLHTSLLSGNYQDIKAGSLYDVNENGIILEWVIPPRTALLLIKK